MATDTLLATWSRYLDQRAQRKGTTLMRVKVKHDDDGVWYLQAGILGPALKVTDRYAVISWSPQALRDALKYIWRKDGDQLDEYLFDIVNDSAESKNLIDTLPDEARRLKQQLAEWEQEMRPHPTLSPAGRRR